MAVVLLSEAVRSWVGYLPTKQ